MLFIIKIGAASEGVSLRNGKGRRNIVISSLGIVAASLFNASNHGLDAAAAQFADSNYILIIFNLKMDIFVVWPHLHENYIIKIAVPALRGKDYGKTKMKYPDYTQTESGLQYKVTPSCLCQTSFIPFNLNYLFL